MRKACHADECHLLEAMPNVGTAVAADLRRLGIAEPAQLIGRDACELYERLCQLTRAYHDPCVLDTLLAAVDFMHGAQARPWWHYTGTRKKDPRCQWVLSQARTAWAADAPGAPTPLPRSALP